MEDMERAHSSKNDPAFPRRGSINYYGMSRRDYLAAHAPVTVQHAQAFFAAGPLPQTEDGVAALFAVWARLRYQYADAMLKESDK